MADQETYQVDHPFRRRLPRVRKSMTYSVRIGGAEAYCQVGLYEDGSPGEIFMTVSKQGSTLGAFADAFSIAVSLALQYGTPLESLCGKFIDMKFEPAGVTDDDEVAEARSLLDYLFRRLAIDYLDSESQERVGVHG